MKNDNKELTREQKELINKYENKNYKKQKKFTKDKRDMYLEQTDRNYKDGDKNW